MSDQTLASAMVIMDDHQNTFPISWQDSIEDFKSPDPFSSDDFMLDGSELPSLYQTFGELNVFSRKPKVELLEMPKRLRFRYASEFKQRPLNHNRNMIKLKVSDFVGKINIHVDLVQNKDDIPHVNRIYLATKQSEWKEQGSQIVLDTVQVQPQQIYDLPSLGVVRMKRSAGCWDDCAGGDDPVESLPSSEDGKLWKVMFRFCVQFERTHSVKIYSDEVLDIKFRDHRCPQITHLNPEYAPCTGDVEVTILGDNLTPKCTVMFVKEKSKFKRRAAVLLCHRQIAVVVKAPLYDRPDGASVEISVVSPDGVHSNTVSFRYLPEDKRSPMDAVYESKVLLELLSRKVKLRMADRGKSVLESDYAAVQTQKQNKRSEGQRRRREREKKLRQEAERKRLEESQSVEDDDNDDTIDFVSPNSEVEKGAVVHRVERSDAPLPVNNKHRLELLAKSRQEMISIDEDGYTPLARAILDGNFDTVLALLRHIPKELANEVLAQRFTTDRLSHLLLTTRSKADSLPLDVIQLLILIGDDPMAVDANGNTLLHLLIDSQRESDLVSFLSGASQGMAWTRRLIDEPNRYGDRPLDLAIARKQALAVDALHRATVTDGRAVEPPPPSVLKCDLPIASNITRLDESMDHPRDVRMDRGTELDVAAEMAESESPTSFQTSPIHESEYVGFEEKRPEWNVLMSELAETLLRMDVKFLADRLFPGNAELHRTLDMVLDPCAVFFASITEEHANHLAEGLRLLGYTFFSHLVMR